MTIRSCLTGRGIGLHTADPTSYVDSRDYYFHYWKYINYGISFGNRGVVGDQFYHNIPEEIARIVNRGKSNFGGKLNAVFADTHAKSWDYIRLIDDLKNNPNSSIWDPYKQGVSQ